MSDEFSLVIGNYNYSSWSLRAWLAVRAAGIECAVVRLPLDTETFYRRIGEFSPAGTVPVLLHGSSRIWESLAICEYLHEMRPQAGLWPTDAMARAHARTIAAEMHAGFQSLRSALPMNCRATGRRAALDSAVLRDIARVESIWNDARAVSGTNGPWLMGAWSLADAMYAPVVFRFRTYGILPGGAAGEYMETQLASPPMQGWLRQAEAESETTAGEEVGLAPGSDGFSPRISALDHLVLTVADIDRSRRFYSEALGLRHLRYGDNRHALSFGEQKLNLHAADARIEPRAAAAAPGTADLCLLTDTRLEDLIAHLEKHAIAIELGPVARTGARGAMQSVYFRDPDGNLIEVASYAAATAGN